jgi:hypothetical protein
MSDLERRIAELLTTHRSSGCCPLDGPCGTCDCFDPQHEYERAHARAIMAEIVGPELERLRALLEKIASERGEFRDDRDRARDAAVALEQQLAEIKKLAYMGGQNGEVIRTAILGVFEGDLHEEAL